MEWTSDLGLLDFPQTFTLEIVSTKVSCLSLGPKTTDYLLRLGYTITERQFLFLGKFTLGLKSPRTYCPLDGIRITGWGVFVTGVDVLDPHRNCDRRGR